LEEIVSLAGGTKQQSAVERIQIDLLELSQKKEGLMEQINKINLEASDKKARAVMLKEQKGKLEQELSALEKKLANHQGEFDEAGSKKEREEEEKKISALNAEIIVWQEKIGQFNATESAKRGKLFETQKKIQSDQAEVNELNREMAEIKVKATRYETKLEDLEAEIRAGLSSLKEIKENRNQENWDIEPLLERISSLKHQLDNIGGIDPEVTKEYETTKERYDFLFSQTDDLNGAIKSLEKIIYELDLIIKERFDAEFKIIAEKFSEYFKILFNGGTARIVKVMAGDDGEKKDEKGKEVAEDEKNIVVDKKEIESNSLNKIKFLKKHNATGLAGIEIEATPPGKKIKSISMLSGGERALTAIALISAIISANPSPFVVLDEVDAALDEANSERLAKILDDLSNKTQFIVISHNRASMRKASVLYGVTMQADGVSQLLSVKLEEAQAG
jgi:chromosome segregation protein